MFGDCYWFKLIVVVMWNGDDRFFMFCMNFFWIIVILRVVGVVFCYGIFFIF